MRFVPGVRRSDGILLIPDTKRGTWIPSVGPEHARKVLSLGAIRRCAIRFVKYWNDNQEVHIESFDIDVLMIKTLTAEGLPGDFHFRLKWFFDEALACLETGWDNDVEAYRLGFEYLSASERRKAGEQFRKARDIANKAWFLAEFRKGGNPLGPIGFYVMLLNGDT